MSLDSSSTRDAPREGQGCTLGHIIEVMKAKSNDSYRNDLLATLRDNEFLLSPDICNILKEVSNHRNRVAHGSEKKSYTLKESHNFLRKIRETNWVFRFLDALQPKPPSTRN